MDKLHDALAQERRLQAELDERIAKMKARRERSEERASKLIREIRSRQEAK